MLNASLQYELAQCRVAELQRTALAVNRRRAGGSTGGGRARAARLSMRVANAVNRLFERGRRERDEVASIRGFELLGY